MTKFDPAWVFSRWDDVRFLLAVLRYGTFSKAAVALRSEQSTVSRRILALESELGFALFERGRRGPVPTEAAERLKDAALGVEVEMSKLADAVSGVRNQEVGGRVKLALTEELAVHFIVPKVLPELRTKYPDLSIELLTSYHAADMVGQEADIALRFFQSSRGDLVGKRIASFPTAVLASRKYASRARHKPLAALDWIAVEITGVTTPEAEWLAAVTDKKPALLCTSYQVQLAAIHAGLGVGIGPAIYTTLDSRVVMLDTPVPLPTLHLYLLTRRAIRHVKRVAVVMAALEQALSQTG